MPEHEVNLQEKHTHTKTGAGPTDSCFRQEEKKNLKHKQDTADADSVIVWIGDRLGKYSDGINWPG